VKQESPQTWDYVLESWKIKGLGDVSRKWNMLASYYILMKD